MLERIYAWIKKESEGPHAVRTLSVVAFLEQSLLFIPPDALLAPIAWHRPKEWVRLSIIATIFSVLGSLFGYFIGYLAYEWIGQSIIQMYNLQTQLEAAKDIFTKHAFIAVFVAALTPIPDKVFTIGSGLFAIPLGVFTLGIALGRGIRFFIIAYLSARYGEAVFGFLKNRFWAVTFLLAALIAGIFYYLQG